MGREKLHTLLQGGAGSLRAVSSVRKKWKHQMEKENRKTTPLLPCQGPACYRVLLGRGERF